MKVSKKLYQEFVSPNRELRESGGFGPFKCQIIIFIAFYLQILFFK
jgi:hypothetical protein